MTGLWRLSWRYAAHHKVQTGILVCCLTVAIFLPTATQVLIGRYNRDLAARAASTPLMTGARGNRFDLTLAGLYFRQSDLDPVPYADYRDLQSQAMGVAIPLNVRFTAKGYPIVGTSVDYYDLRGLRPVEGTLPLMLGDVVLGADVATELELSVGDALFSDQKELYDISKPSALKMRVCGVLGTGAGPDNGAVFVDIRTIWMLEGAMHGHIDPESEQLDESMVLGRTDEFIAISQALIDYNEVTDENAASFHVHGDEGLLPLTAVIFVPHDQKAGTLIKARVNAAGRNQMVVPSTVIADLMAFVFRIKALFDTIFLVLIACTAALTVLVMLLSMRLRAREIETLNKIGCSRFTVAKLCGLQLGMIALLSVALAASALTVAIAIAPSVIGAG